MSGYIAGIPYILVALSYFFWLRTKPDTEYAKYSCQFLAIFVGVLFFLSASFSLYFGADRNEAIISGLGLSLIGILFGGIYIGIALLGRAALTSLGIIHDAP